ncbi:MAG: ribonuclease J [Acholeplasmatales bacterium]|nr:ribonuclease J [Acholeplasmatales bacterium]MBQ6782565.1 ribonuclease J [Acholeplasmatales bacterium]
MSKINFIAIGGVQEDGKNLFCIEVDEKIFILDCGNKYPTSELYGVDIIVNDLSYIIDNLSRVQGVFLSHAHSDHIGGVSYLLREKKLKVYGSRFTIAVLKSLLTDEEVDFDDDELEVVTSKTALHFGDVTVRFFEVSHNIPECFGIALSTKDGYIIYTANYNFDQNSRIDYSHMFRSLAVFSKEGVLALLTESLGAMNEESRGTILEFKTRMINLLTQVNNRVIFTMFSSDILRIKQICDIAISQGKRIAILGIKTQKLVRIAIQQGYISIPEDKFVQLKYIDENNLNDDKDLVVIVTGERHEPYHMLQRMARGFDRLVRLNENDTIVVLTTPYIGTEKMAARTLDIVYHVTSKIKTFDSKLLPRTDANREEIKEMINILKPKYIIPVIGEYRHQYALRIVADCINYKDDQVIIPDNGDIISFVNGKYVGVTGDVPCGELMIDGKAFKDVSDVVMRDRELLAKDGLILITANINPRTKTVVLGPEIVTKGFVFNKENEDVNENMKGLFTEVSKTFLASKFINWSEYKIAIKNEISHYIYKEVKRSPIIIPVLISTDTEAINAADAE